MMLADEPVTIGNDAAALYAARLAEGESVVLPATPYGHLFVVSGAVAVEAGRLAEGDALRTVGAGVTPMRADADGTEILFWAMRAQARSALR